MSLNDLSEDLQELKELRKLAQRKCAQEILDIQIRKTSDALDRLKSQESQKGSVTEANTKLTKDSTAKVYTVTLRTYSWDQSDKFVKLYVTIPSLKPSDEENVKCVFSSRSASLIVSEVDGKNYELVINNLAKQIVPDKSFWKVKKDMVVMMLSKERLAQSWPAVTAEEVKIKEKNKPEDPDTSDPSAGMMGLMKKMYDEGDDKMKQLLNKTWYESQSKAATGAPGLGSLPDMNDI
ncbi:calcyclin-binding protein isoform X2 [Hyalella azteca]|uniref:Calcyclin-binding protein n=1 Tax=Hyalella azteca TaxID=294128 RepID=A0A8B7PMZ0_HYAAZ|nr:calcyclin-binding protein isoform X2 [Hyalella azteca]